jgi:hypothetical protein
MVSNESESSMPWEVVRPNIDRYGRSAIEAGMVMKINLYPILDEEDRKYLPYSGKDKDTVILELCMYTKQLEINMRRLLNSIRNDILEADAILDGEQFKEEVVAIANQIPEIIRVNLHD